MRTSSKNDKHKRKLFSIFVKQTTHMTLEQTIAHVATFHDAFGIGNNYAPTAELSEADIMLRYKLMREENEEYLEAAQRGDLVEVADALGDMLYILCGTILKHGLQDKIAEVFEEIQRSNMSKLDKDGKPIYREDGKVLKSELYFKPDIRSILEAK
jgi:predicted HAD superfamily Cof-like phosphohydrolase